MTPALMPAPFPDNEFGDLLHVPDTMPASFDSFGLSTILATALALPVKSLGGLNYTRSSTA